MKKFIFSAVLLLFASACAWGQGGAVAFAGITNPQGQPVPGVQLHFCFVPAVVTNGICSPSATVYKDQGLAQPWGSAIVTDGLGNFPVIWFTPGDYCYSVSGFPAQTNVCEPFSVAVGGLNPVFTNVTVTGSFFGGISSVFCLNGDTGLDRNAPAWWNMGNCTPGDQSGTLSLGLIFNDQQFTAAGTAAAPSHAFKTDSSTGSYLAAPGTYGIAAGGVSKALFSANGATFPGPIPWVDPMAPPYNAKCDWNGTTGTDDSAALQSAINAAIAAGSWLYVPGGKKCSHATTLNMTNGGSTSVKLIGTGYSSGLVYTGTGTGWLWKDGPGNISIFATVVKDVFLICSNAAGCTKGIEAWDLQNGYFDKVLINATGINFASTAFYCNGCAILDIDGLVMEGQSVAGTAPTIGLDCLNCNSIWVHHGNFGYFTTATTRFAGTSVGIVIDSNWFESQDVGVLIDDSVAATTIDGGFFVSHNRFLANGAFAVVPPGGTFANQVAVKVNNTGTNSIIVRDMQFTENTYFCATAGGLCSAAYPILIAYSATTGGSTLLNMGITGNHFFGQATGIANVTNGPSAAQTQLLFKDNDERVTTVLAAGTQYTIIPVESNQSLATQVHLASNTDTAEHVMLNGGVTVNQDACLDFGDKTQALKAELCWGQAGNAMSLTDNGHTGWQVLNDGSFTANIKATSPTFVSTVATGTAPLTVTSTTPVANLAATPTTYSAGGAQQVNAHLVVDTCTLGTNCGITLAGSAVFTSATSYTCTCHDQTTPANACLVNQTAGNGVTITGTGTDVIRYMCAGN